MDYFKIINILFMIFVLYKFYLNDIVSENFETTPSLADDWNAINQLAQISRQLMTGGSTLPGNFTVTGTLNAGNTTVGTLNAGNTTVGTLNAGNTSVGTLTATGKISGPGWSIDTDGLLSINKLKLGKFFLSGVGDYAANDNTIRPTIYGSNPTKLADFSANSVWRVIKYPNDPGFV